MAVLAESNAFDLLTTGKAADKLLGLAKNDPLLLTPDVTDWLKRVKKAAEDRNEIVHALARDRCVACGNATKFEHRGTPVDRSPASIGRVTGRYQALISNGVQLARLISQRLNEREVAKAKADAASTGKPQYPRQIMIGQNWHRCEACSEDGAAVTAVVGTAAVVVVPPQT